MTSRRWQDDEGLLAELREAVRRAGGARPSVRETARAAFTRRSREAGLALASLSYDSLLDDALQLRAGAESSPRIVMFQAEAMSVEIELAHGNILGQLIPPTGGEVMMMTLDGITGQAAADAMGCFVLSLPKPGPARFRCQTAESELITDWVRL
jgi:hypothetical protein